MLLLKYSEDGFFYFLNFQGWQQVADICSLSYNFRLNIHYFDNNRLLHFLKCFANFDRLMGNTKRGLQGRNAYPTGAHDASIGFYEL